MHVGSRVIVSLVNNPANSFYATVAGFQFPAGSGDDAQNYLFTFNDGASSIHFANGTVNEGDRADFYLKPSSRDIITGIDITPRSIAHTHILQSVLTPDLLNDGGDNPAPGQVLSVNTGATEFDWIDMNALGTVFDSDSDGLVPAPGDSDAK